MENSFKSAPFYYRLYGDYALFTDPVTKGGGEKYTYSIPTCQALKGITEQIYWKPTLTYFIDSVKIIKRIQTETKGIRTPLKNGTNDLNYYTYLRDVEYLVQFHFEWNQNRPELKADQNEIKHERILLRSMEKGGRRDIFLGTRECVGFVERIREEQFKTASTYYDGKKLSFGIMFHSFSYPGENEYQGGGKLISNFADIKMGNGKVDFIRPEECQIHHTLRTYGFKSFNEGNMKFADEEIDSRPEEVEMQ
ncbi:type I-C CRISPR-associated protein Cas5c [Muricomes intestini]|uniref:type I-C CRISPR-associated protein Cas5c n=1 Tax=Muricomes intestini TaxID=1796634 RepID=UPI002FE0FFD3